MRRISALGVFVALSAAMFLVAAPSQACGPAAGGGTVFSFNAGPAYGAAFVAPQQAYVQRQFVVQPQAVILQNRVHRQPFAFAPVRRSFAAARGAVRGFARGY